MSLSSSICVTLPLSLSNNLLTNFLWLSISLNNVVYFHSRTQFPPSFSSFNFNIFGFPINKSVLNKNLFFCIYTLFVVLCNLSSFTWYIIVLCSVTFCLVQLLLLLLLLFSGCVFVDNALRKNNFPLSTMSHLQSRAPISAKLVANMLSVAGADHIIQWICTRHKFKWVGNCCGEFLVKMFVNVFRASSTYPWTTCTPNLPSWSGSKRTSPNGEIP